VGKGDQEFTITYNPHFTLAFGTGYFLKGGSENPIEKELGSWKND